MLVVDGNVGLTGDGRVIERRLDVVVACTRLVERSVHAVNATVDASAAINNA